MFETLKSVFKVKEMRRKLLYLIWMIFVIRIGSQLPVPGVDSDFFKQWFESNTGDAFNFFDAFTGGSFTQMSIFALNITPYITSSIIIQLLTIAIPALEEMQRDGEEGRKKLTAITRYVTVGLALFESVAMAIGFGRQGMIPNMNFLKGIVVVASLTAGSAMLMWLGERITEKGIGNVIEPVLFQKSFQSGKPLLHIHAAFFQRKVMLYQFGQIHEKEGELRLEGIIGGFPVKEKPKLVSISLHIIDLKFLLQKTNDKIYIDI